ncbi:MAG: class I SAM-dependent methyltransferase [Candidatus Delongbacteria bacterium]|nr:class I SAM-dependent methyltransferase [Candidatus Delongbacteria bacterium]
MSNNLTYKYRVNESTLYECSTCGFIQVDEKPSEAELSAVYSNLYFDNNKYTDDLNQYKENRRRLSFINRYLRPESGNKPKLLDFGCASGDFIQAAKPIYEIWGHDFSDYAIEKARHLNPDIADHFSSGSYEKIDFPHEFFDGMVIWDVIEHLWDPLTVCRRLLLYLKPGGFLFISTPSIGSLTASLTRRYWIFMTPPEHLAFFSTKSISFLLQNQLNCRIMKIKNQGKSVNMGFFFYKLKRIFPRLIPHFYDTKLIRTMRIYIPTGDIMYVAAIKPE